MSREGGTMRFGIDLGTTRTVIAAVDRGNYPLLSVEDALGDSHDYVPSVVALSAEGEILCGWEALPLEESDSFTRSFKRLLSQDRVTAHTPLRMGAHQRSIGEVLSAFAKYLVAQLRRYQEEMGDTSTPEVTLGVPANAHSAQRLLTLSALTEAGVTVLGLVNEPSAAAFEYTHRHSATLNSRRSSIIVYDLGGGTFDATLLHINGGTHDVVQALGISRLGGDDFDEVLADIALAVAGQEADAYGKRARRALVAEARTAKEALTAQSRRMIIEVGSRDVVVPVEDFYTAITPLVERTVDLLTPLATEDLRDTDIAGVYLVGGASSLPLIPRMLRQRFGRRVHRSPLPTASTAIGLAIAADPSSSYQLHDRLSRGIGVFREWAGGQDVSFDPLVLPDTAPDASGQITVVRRYRAAHNVGWYRLVEYNGLNHHTPSDFTFLTELVVPFDAALIDAVQGGGDGESATFAAGGDRTQDSENFLREVPVVRHENGPLVQETLVVDSNGIASLTIDVPELGVHRHAEVEA